MLALIGQFRGPYFTVRPVFDEWKKLSSLSKKPLKRQLREGIIRESKPKWKFGWVNDTILEAIEVSLSYVAFIGISHAIPSVAVLFLWVFSPRDIINILWTSFSRVALWSYGTLFFPPGFMAQARRAWAVNLCGKNSVRKLTLRSSNSLCKWYVFP